MNRLIVYLLSILCLAFSLPAHAGLIKKSAVNPQQQQDQAQKLKIVLYEENDGKKIIAELPANIQLIPIFRQGQWMKVANPKNGQVGWVNIDQYQKARQLYFQPNIQTIYVRVDKDSSGKPTVNVVAYRNGKALSELQSKELYARLQRQQLKQYREFQKLNQDFVRLFNQDIDDINRFMNVFSLHPIIILPNDEKEKLSAHKQQPATEKQIN